MRIEVEFHFKAMVDHEALATLNKSLITEKDVWTRGQLALMSLSQNEPRIETVTADFENGASSYLRLYTNT